MGCTSSVAEGEYAEYAGEGRRVPLEKGGFDAAFSLGEVLGSGGFARVHAVRRRADDARLAVKVVPLPGAPSSAVEPGKLCPPQGMKMKEVVGELTAWSAVRGSEHVVSLVSAMVEGHRAFMVMERCECSLARKVSESPGFWAVESRRILKEMLLGVQACHRADIVHRDVKPQNYLVGSDGSTVKLCDFGLAVKMPRIGQLRELAGTIPFTSPEMLMDSGYGKATDVWSYGVTAYLMCFGVFPFPKAFCQDTECMKKAILLGLPARCLQNGSGEAAFISPQMERCRSARCTVEQALAHWYLQEDPHANAKSPKSRYSNSSDASTADVGIRSSSLETGSSGSVTPRPVDDGSASTADVGIRSSSLETSSSGSITPGPVDDGSFSI